MGRVIVLGASGFFGGALVEELKRTGITPLRAARRGSVDLRIDAEDESSLQSQLKPGDLILDAAGPFQRRTEALVSAAMRIGCDVIDLADHVGYVRAVSALKKHIDASGIRVVSACSSLSAVTASLIRASPVRTPAQVTVILIPSAKKSATRGTAHSLLAGVGRPVAVWENRILAVKTGWQDKRTFHLPDPFGTRKAYSFESADAWILPKLWPTLSHVSCYVDSNVPLFNTALSLAARSHLMHALLKTALPLGIAISRILGSKRGALACELEGSDGEHDAFVLSAERNAYRTAVIPAALSAQALVKKNPEQKGLLAPDALFTPDELTHALQAAGVKVLRQTQILVSQDTCTRTKPDCVR